MLAAALVVPAAAQAYVPVVTPNGSTLPYKLDRGVKVFHLVAEQVKREIAPGMVGVEEKVRKLLPGYMAMGQTGMGDMMDMGRPPNTLPMMTGKGQFGTIDMGGMFTVVKVREGITSYADPGPYKNPPGTVARKVAEESGKQKRPESDHQQMHQHGGTD